MNSIKRILRVGCAGYGDAGHWPRTLASASLAEGPRTVSFYTLRP